MNIIVTKDLTFQYSIYNNDNNETKITALNNLNIQIGKGEFIAILGHNGSGKSTLAKHLNALLLPTEGSVTVNGLLTNEEENLWNIRQTVGMVFQNPDNQLIATSVEDDIAFGPENLGVKSDEIIKRVEESLTAVNMNNYKTSPPHFLSGGQKQRICIAGILAMHPDIIIFDESTAMLDPIGRTEVIETAIKLNKEKGITVILITHFMEEAVCADRVIVMQGGSVVMDDVPKNIFSKVEEMKKLGLNVPQVTELSYNLKKLGLKICGDILTVDDMVGALCLLK